MDLSSLYSTLPPEQLQQAEKEMMDKFRQAALSITHLYKASMHTSKQAYSAGYSACLSDILQTVQASLSASSLQSPSSTTFDTSTPSASQPTTYRADSSSTVQNTGEPSASAAAARTLGRLMDWVEARQEALRIEAEEEEREREKERDGSAGLGVAEGSQRGGSGQSSSQAQGRASGRPVGPLRSRSRSTQPQAHHAVHFTDTPGMKSDAYDDEQEEDQDPMSSSIASLPGYDSSSSRLAIPVSGAELMTSPTLTATLPPPTPQYRQRNALVQAVQRATAARSQSPKSADASGQGTASDHSAEEGGSGVQDRGGRMGLETPSSPPSQPFTPQQAQDDFASSPVTIVTPTANPVFRPTANTVLPAHGSTPASTFHAGIRPLKPLQYHRTKSGGSHARKDKDHTHHQSLRNAILTDPRLEDENGAPIFAPFLPATMPNFPVFPVGTPHAAPDARVQDFPVGSKRPHDASGNATGIPLERNGNARSGGGRKRGHGGGKGHGGGGVTGWDVDMDGAGGPDGGDERERKRVARR